MLSTRSRQRYAGSRTVGSEPGSPLRSYTPHFSSTRFGNDDAEGVIDGVCIVGDTEGVFERVAVFDGVLEAVEVGVPVCEAVFVEVGVEVLETASLPPASSASAMNPNRSIL